MTGLKLYYLLRGTVAIFKYSSQHMKDLSQMEIVELRRVDDAFFNFHQSLQASREVIQKSLQKGPPALKSSLGSKAPSRRPSSTRKNGGGEPAQKGFSSLASSRLILIGTPTVEASSHLYTLMLKHQYKPLAPNKTPEPDEVFFPSEMVQMSFEESNRMLMEMVHFCNTEYAPTKGFLDGSNQTGQMLFEIVRQRFFGRKLKDMNSGAIFGERALDNEQQPRTASVAANGVSEFLTLGKHDYDSHLKTLLTRNKELKQMLILKCFPQLRLVSNEKFIQYQYACQDGRLKPNCTRMVLDASVAPSQCILIKSGEVKLTVNPTRLLDWANGLTDSAVQLLESLKIKDAFFQQLQSTYQLYLSASRASAGVTSLTIQVIAQLGVGELVGLETLLHKKRKAIFSAEVISDKFSYCTLPHDFTLAFLCPTSASAITLSDGALINLANLKALGQRSVLIRNMVKMTINRLKLLEQRLRRVYFPNEDTELVNEVDPSLRMMFNSTGLRDSDTDPNASEQEAVLLDAPQHHRYRKYLKLLERDQTETQQGHDSDDHEPITDIKQLLYDKAQIMRELKRKKFKVQESVASEGMLKKQPVSVKSQSQLQLGSGWRGSVTWVNEKGLNPSQLKILNRNPELKAAAKFIVSPRQLRPLSQESLLKEKVESKAVERGTLLTWTEARPEEETRIPMWPEQEQRVGLTKTDVSIPETSVHSSAFMKTQYSRLAARAKSNSAFSLRNLGRVDKHSSGSPQSSSGRLVVHAQHQSLRRGKSPQSLRAASRGRPAAPSLVYEAGSDSCRIVAAKVASTAGKSSSKHLLLQNSIQRTELLAGRANRPESMFERVKNSVLLRALETQPRRAAAEDTDEQCSGTAGEETERRREPEVPLELVFRNVARTRKPVGAGESNRPPTEYRAIRTDDG